MLCKIKVLIILLIVFLASGCTANYTVEIKNNDVYEEFSFIETSSEKLNSINKENGSSYLFIINKVLNDDFPAFIKTSDILYEKEKIEENGLGMKLSYTYNIENYKQSYIVNNTFDNFNVLDQNNMYVISTGVGVKSFTEYELLDNITIHLKTNHEVKKSNADRVDGYNYYWDINKSNYKNKYVYIEMYKNKYISNYNNVFIYIVIGIVGILCIIGVIAALLRMKSKKNNSI